MLDFYRTASDGIATIARQRQRLLVLADALRKTGNNLLAEQLEDVSKFLASAAQDINRASHDELRRQLQLNDQHIKTILDAVFAGRQN